MEKFVVNKNQNGEFKYDFIDKNEQIILSKSGYKNRTLCLNAIASIQKNAQDDSKFFRKRTTTNECYFNLKSSNGQILGTSIFFEDKKTREEMIQYFKTIINNTVIEDISKKNLSPA